MKCIVSVLLSLLFLFSYFGKSAIDTAANVPPIANLSSPVTKSFIDLNPINLLVCGHSSGTSIIIGKNLMLTANHVIDGYAICSMYGIKSTVVYKNIDQDIAAVVVPTGNASRLEVNCGGFKSMETYYAVGFAEGKSFIVNKLIAMDGFVDVPIINDRRMAKHLRPLLGTVIPGMSGGPILDEDGKVVGITLATSVIPGSSGDNPVAYSRELKETFLCEKTPSTK